MGFLFVTNNDQSAISNLLHTTLHRHRQQTDRQTEQTVLRPTDLSHLDVTGIQIRSQK